MKKLLLTLFVSVFILLPSYAGKYDVFHPYNYTFDNNAGEKLLFILDLSNSMNETLENSTKFNLMLKTLREVLPKISADTQVGLRIYGYRMGFTPVEACRASTLAVPIVSNNVDNIQSALSKRKPRGMTPITFSLKQAIKYDFGDFIGKKHIVLMTDGGENCDESPCSFVMQLIKFRRDVQIDVIAFNINNSDDLNQLRCTALVTSGKFYNAQTSAQLFDGFNNSIKGIKNVDAKILLPDFK
jgi:Ca-activated chloride channel family protein